MSNFKKTLDKAIDTCDAASVEDMNKITTDYGTQCKMAMRRIKQAGSADEVSKIVIEIANKQTKVQNEINRIMGDISKTANECSKSISGYFNEVNSKGMDAFYELKKKAN